MSPLLLVAISARALARSACRAGMAATAVDAFGDVDTMTQAQRWRHAPLVPQGGFNPKALLDAIDQVCLKPATLVYGAGFEPCPGMLDQLAERHTIAGNSASALRAVQDSQRWFPLLDRLGIPHPTVRWEPPYDTSDWLRKRTASSGGRHVLAAVAVTPEAESDDWYFQRRIDGHVLSMLFLADGHTMRTVGVNRLLTAPPEAVSPWVWSGAVRPAGLATRLRGQVEDAARALVKVLGLRGLNGLDFIVKDGHWFLLELNPRPTATLELWDVSPMPPLLALHLRACEGELPETLPPLPGGQAMRVVYAGRTVQVPAGLRWSADHRDRPRTGEIIQRGEPICTVHSWARSSGSALARTQARHRGVLHTLQAQEQPRRGRRHTSDLQDSAMAFGASS